MQVSARRLLGAARWLGGGRELWFVLADFGHDAVEVGGQIAQPFDWTFTRSRSG